MWHANTKNFCNNELKQRILSGLLKGILLQPISSKVKLTILNKKCIKWKWNRSLKNLFFKFLFDQKLFHSNVHADPQSFVGLCKSVSIFWTNNYFAWWFFCIFPILRLCLLLWTKKNTSYFQPRFSVYLAGQMPKYCFSRHKLMDRVRDTIRKYAIENA